MSTSRRTFLKKGTLAVAGATLFSNEIFAAAKPSTILGIQLYSVRDDMKKDPLGTLKQISAIGYKYVEHAGYGDRKFYGKYSATEFKKILDDLGLKMKSGHTSMGRADWDETKNDFTDKWKNTVEDAATAGQAYVISPWLDESYRKNIDDLKRFLQVFNKSGELCKKSGMKFGYHNHDFEFSQQFDGKKVFDIILENTDPSLVAQQLDIGNMYHAGGIALDIMKKYPGRFELMHVKDEIKTDKAGEMGGGYESTILGKGIIPVKEIVDLGKKSGTVHFIIEQESYQGMAPVDTVKEDYEIMRKWGY
ncbi:sugar phosphate isomerase/epimerase [Panacibacter ginsenosidivorans]|uniref:Sugar phosphate isomerase/epimerase n=1 Tax=Panacibacter ginsenosidivorans TaxID=1813871 RepID=A0A5B8V2T1_9BACT|nr:sugar phosphate isomerase/epimerase [Panacibacter ginsenosidivorans]QEC65817.1 sugar phosphate isomerase/epimerase [Panacibacter ginsenosidivorans]